MIGYVKGTVERIFASSVFIDVHGVGYRVYAPVSTLAHLNVGEESLLYTYMNVREDAIVLYGFLTQDEYDLFMLLIGVNGVGPKVANGILSATGTDSFRAAVANKDIGLLTKMPQEPQHQDSEKCQLILLHIQHHPVHGRCQHHIGTKADQQQKNV